jgi:hypothetical protein
MYLVKNETKLRNKLSYTAVSAKFRWNQFSSLRQIPSAFCLVCRVKSSQASWYHAIFLKKEGRHSIIFSFDAQYAHCSPVDSTVSGSTCKLDCSVHTLKNEILNCLPYFSKYKIYSSFQCTFAFSSKVTSHFNTALYNFITAINSLSHLNMSGLMIAGWRDETSNLTEVSLYCARLHV